MADSVEDLNLTPPQTAQDNAQKVLDWRDEHGDEVNGMTRTGWIRANQLADGEELSPNIVKRMAQFNRHRSNSGVSDEYRGEPWKDSGRVAWLGWGGDAGVDWAIRMSERIQSIENSGRDKITTLSHKHSDENNDLDVVENMDIRSQISGGSNSESSSSVDNSAISLNTYNGYFEDKEFDEQNWEESINRLRQIHGSVRNYIMNLMRHEDEGHGRPENVPVFQEPVDTETFNEFVKNVDENVEEDTFTDLVKDAQKVDRTLRELFVEMVEHDNFMHDREGFEVKQLLSENLSKGEDYDTVSGCVEYHMKNKGWSDDKSYAVCAEEFDIEMFENSEYSTLEDCIDDKASADDMSREEATGVCLDMMNMEENEELQKRKNIKEAEMLAEQVWTLKDVMRQFGDEFERIARELETEKNESEVKMLKNQTVDAVDLLMTKIKSPAYTVVNEMSEDEDDDEESGLITRPRELDENASEGDKARWNGGGGNAYGVVEDVETDGTLEAEPEGPEMEGTEDNPAYGLRNYEVKDGEWTETDVYVVHREDAITVIEDFPDMEDENTETMASGIVPTHEALGDFGTTESEDWSRPNYSEFQEAYDFEENYADLDTDDKRTVAAHFGRVDNDSYEDSAYGDLQLPHHDPETGDVDRAGVIAARQRLPQSDMPQDTLDEIDTHLTEHLREDFEESDVEPIFEEEENSENDYRSETVNNETGLKQGQLVSFDTDYGKSFGRVKEQLSDDYVIEVYKAELGGGWTSSGREKVCSTEELSEEDMFPDSLNDVFRNNSGSSVSATEVGEKSQSEEVVEESEDNVVEDVGAGKIQQVGRKVRTVSEVLTDDQLNDYLDRNDIDYSVEEFRDLVEKF